jgi:hypothetical protein
MNAEQHRSPVQADAGNAAKGPSVCVDPPGRRRVPTDAPPNPQSNPATPAVSKNNRNSPVVLRCPRCGKRLPFSGTLSMLGTASVYCRNCGRTVEVTMRIPDDETPNPVERAM